MLEFVTPRRDSVHFTLMQTLPAELIIRILSFLPFKDIVISSGVSRQFREVVDTSSTLEYILELGLCGFIDLGHGDLNTAERLRRLREREEAWSTLTWRSSRKIPVTENYICWELCGNLFAGTFLQRNSLSVESFACNAVDLFDLGSQVADGPTRRIIIEKPFWNFSIDPGQDLLVFVEGPQSLPKVGKAWIMHIRSLATGLTHPRASRPQIEISLAHESWPDPIGYPGTLDTQILGHVILCSQRRGPGHSGSISVINWTTGTEIFLFYPPLGDWCCTLLSETELLLAERASFRSQPSLELYRLSGPSKWAAPQTTFQLPFLDGLPTWQPAFCYSPASFSSMVSPAGSAVSPFTCPPTPHLLAFRFKLKHHRYFMPTHLDMFVLVDQLRKYLHIGDVVPWEVWGPPSTRIFREILPRVWRRNIYGYRAILPNNNTVLDFNSNLWNEGDPGVVTQSTHISLNNGSREVSIVSSLPYRELKPAQPFGNDAVLSEYIVCIEMDSNGSHMVKALQVLGF